MEPKVKISMADSHFGDNDDNVPWEDFVIV
jgi:hypothetical protein